MKNLNFTKTQKIIALFATLTAIAFILWGCGGASTEVKKDSVEVKVDSLKVDTSGKK